jgi:hypothetical protein
MTHGQNLTLPNVADRCLLSRVIQTSYLSGVTTASDPKTDVKRWDRARRVGIASLQDLKACVRQSHFSERRLVYRPLPTSTKCATYRKRSDSGHKRRVGATSPADQLNSLYPAQQFRENSAHLHARQLMTDAEMRTAAEGDMRIVRAVDAERVGVWEYGFVPVARTKKSANDSPAADPQESHRTSSVNSLMP